MSNNNTYVIRIENNTKSKSSPIANSAGNGSSGSSGKPTNDKGGDPNLALKLLVAGDKFAAPFVEQAINYQVSTIELRTGASELQQRVEFGMNVAKQAIGIGATFVAGVATGNPLLIVGSLMSAATTAINYANKAKTIQLEANLESISLRGLNTRAGGYAPSYGASRMGRQ